MGRWLAEFKREPHEQAAFDKKPKDVIDFETEARKAKEALKKYGIAKIRSRALDGEIIYFAKDKQAARRTPKGAVVYTLEELAALLAEPVPDKDGLRQIHECKKLFGGTLLKSGM